MDLKFFKKLVLIGLMVYLPSQAMAWGMLGHRIVGEIADRHLSKKARKNIQQILGNETVAMASNWADFIKSDPAYDYLGSWHYINVKPGVTLDQFSSSIMQDTSTNIHTKLNMMVAELKKKDLPQAKKEMYLRLVIHMVGDIHQPMHAGRPEDLGGNRVRLTWFNTPTNLHRVWDEQLIEYQQLSYTEYATVLNHVSKNQRNTWQQAPVSTWIYESYQIADKLYEGVKPEDKLSYRYNFDHVNTLNDQLLKGGVRLAGLLNEIFG
ncbi:S1/P1 nuclease [uncultured Pontibacter sp.]|uniref:S1/P1 nuclease n=1 Tax=uncultured Pontibacter sp. TaxID=453356 RepID=UPI00263825B2|nr:S1/P1 nuclease [uncultured Pontibacter sp.]